MINIINSSINLKKQEKELLAEKIREKIIGVGKLYKECRDVDKEFNIFIGEIVSGYIRH